MPGGGGLPPDLLENLAMAGYSITTFGCQMNVHDSERLHEVLREAGYVEANAPGEADVVVLNTCSVREKAEHKLRSEVGKLMLRKQACPTLTIVVAGCVAQQEGERFLKRVPGVDLVIGPDNIAELPGLLSEVAMGAPPIARTVFDTDAPRFLSAQSVRAGAVTAFVTTMKGCDERCSFCIVPHTRGPERYRPSDDIAVEIAALAERGVREVTLLGQTVNSYRDPTGRLERAPAADPDDSDESEFAALLRHIAARVPELTRLRYVSPHPRHLTPSLIRAHAELSLLPRHVHLPVQSGSDRMLKRMIRRYRRDEFVERVAALRSAVPGVSLSTDMIVGFPGETEEDFELTLSLVREVRFVGLYGFKYSPRPYTPALKLGDDVPEAVKSERLSRLFEVSEALIGEHLHALVGSTAEVLFEGLSRNASGLAAGACTGRTERNEIVHVAGVDSSRQIGQLSEVRITGAFKHSLSGELTESSKAQSSGEGASQRTEHVPPSSLGAHVRRVLPMLPRTG